LKVILEGKYPGYGLIFCPDMWISKQNTRIDETERNRQMIARGWEGKD
jgi:hypothetical protein